MEIVFLIIGLVIGFLIGWLILKLRYSSAISSEEAEQLKSQLNQLQAEKVRFEERENGLKESAQKSSEELERERGKVVELSSSVSRMEETNNNLKERLEEQKGEIEELQQKFTKEFENLANKILTEKSETFTKQNRENLDQILKPLGDKIKEFKEKVEDVYDKETRDRTSLSEQLKTLFDLNQKMTKEATNLTNALKGETKTQGNWGEFILEKLLDDSGLVKNREYFVQESIKTEDGRRLQPDVILRLPDNRSIVIDSKVTLIAYERYNASDDKESKEKAIKEHILSVKNHYKDLSSKNYHNLYGVESLDFVFMFMPIEPAWSLALQNDRELFNDALERRIAIVSPTMLMVNLKMIASIWRQENQNKNALEIARQSGALYDKFVGFVDDLVTVGRKIDDSKSSYVDAMKKLTDGSGNLVRRAEKIKQLGAKTSKSLPKSVLDRADDEDDTPLIDE